MPWIEAVLRGQRVLARARDDGTLVVEGGRVEIRYRPNDGRPYRAAAGNLAVVPDAKVLADDTCTAPSAERALPKGQAAVAPRHSPHRWSAYPARPSPATPAPARCAPVHR